METKGNRDDPEVAAWIEWRSKNKAAAAAAAAVQAAAAAAQAKPPALMTQLSRPPAAAFNQLSRATPLPVSPSGQIVARQQTPVGLPTTPVHTQQTQQVKREFINIMYNTNNRSI